MATSVETQPTVRDVGRALLRHKKKMAAFFVVTMGLVVVALALWPPTYASEAMLYVRPGREQLTLDPVTTTDETIHMERLESRTITSVMRLLESRVIAERVVDELGAEAILNPTADAPAGSIPVDTITRSLGKWLGRAAEEQPDTEGQRNLAVLQVVDSITVAAPEESNVISVTCTADSPLLAQSITAEYCTSFLREHARLSRTQGTHAFFSEQVELLAQQLASAERELREAKNEYDLLGIEGQREILEAEVREVEIAALDAESSLSAAEARVEFLKQQLRETSPTLVTETVSGFGHLATDSIRERLFELEVAESDVLANHTPNHPRAVAIRKQLAEVRAIMEAQPESRSQVTDSLNPTYQAVEQSLVYGLADAAAFSAKSTMLAQQQQRLQQRIDAMNTQAMHVAQLERSAEILEAAYRAYADKLEVARIDEAIVDERLSSINIVQPATMDREPVSPQRRIIFAAGLLFASLGSLGIALFAEHLDDTLRDPEDVEGQLDLPVLHTVARVHRRAAITV